VTLALAVAALLLAGCGGGSSEGAPGASTGSSGSTTSSSSKSASADPASAGGGAKAKAQGKAGEGGSATKGASGPGSAGHSAAEGQKHGPHITAPKGPPEQAPSPEQVANATVADITLQSPAIVAAAGAPGRLAATYTCDGKDSWPALHWGGVPPGTAELILYAMNVQPVEGQLFVDWALAGLDPGLEEIGAGELPRGAVVGKNSFGKTGYSLCPTGAGEIYMFALYALPQSLSLNRGFDAREVRKQILDVSGNVGLLPAVYERG
jgi:phosphatidylethanolamine-binding protein (PEBP) family uncharacterized protein